jgi:hypothetical protein
VKKKDVNRGYEVYQQDSGFGGEGKDTTYTEGDYNFCIGGTNKKAKGERICPKCTKGMIETKLTVNMIQNAGAKRNGYSYCTKKGGC